MPIRQVGDMVAIIGENLSSWADALSELAFKFTRDFEGQFGYSPGENSLVRAAPEAGAETVEALAAAGVPRALCDFYGQVERVSLPDLDSRYFVHSAVEVLSGVNGEQPTKLDGNFSDSIVVFGSDGGGGLFALGGARGNVYRLSGGSVMGDTYQTGRLGEKVASSDFRGFLEILRGELVNSIIPR